MLALFRRCVNHEHADALCLMYRVLRAPPDDPAPDVRGAREASRQSRARCGIGHPSGYAVITRERIMTIPPETTLKVMCAATAGTRLPVFSR